MESGRKREMDDQNGATYIDFFPLADVADQSREPEQTHQTEEFGQTEDPQRPSGLQNLEALAEILHP